MKFNSGKIVSDYLADRAMDVHAQSLDHWPLVGAGMLVPLISARFDHKGNEPVYKHVHVYAYLLVNYRHFAIPI